MRREEERAKKSKDESRTTLLGTVYQNTKEKVRWIYSNQTLVNEREALTNTKNEIALDRTRMKQIRSLTYPGTIGDRTGL